MNTARKIDSSTNLHLRYRRHNDRVIAVNSAVQRVEREHAARLRRMTMLLLGATSLLVINGLLIALLG